MPEFQEMNTDASFAYIQKKIDQDVKAGKLSRERAHQVLKGARKNYANNSYNREMQKLVDRGER